MNCWFERCVNYVNKRIIFTELLLFCTHPYLLCSPLSLLSSGYKELFLLVKWSGNKADDSFPSNADTKSAWNFAFTPKFVMIWSSTCQLYLFTFMYWNCFRPCDAQLRTSKILCTVTLSVRSTLELSYFRMWFMIWKMWSSFVRLVNTQLCLSAFTSGTSAASFPPSLTIFHTSLVVCSVSW